MYFYRYHNYFHIIFLKFTFSLEKKKQKYFNETVHEFHIFSLVQGNGAALKMHWGSLIASSAVLKETKPAPSHPQHVTARWAQRSRPSLWLM